MNASPGPPVIFDSHRRIARLNRAQTRFAGADFLHARTATDAVASLEVLLRDWPTVSDLSPLPGPFAKAVAASDVAGRVGPIRVIDAVVTRAEPGGGPLGLAEGSQDLIVSLFGLHWANDLPGALAQIRRALKPDGLFIGAMLGGSTLKELRTVLTEAELEVRGGAQARVSPFADGFDGAGLLQRAGFALPVSDVDRLTVRYPDLFALLMDLRAMGETNVLAGPTRPLTRGILSRTVELYGQRFGEDDGRIPATFEIVTLSGWAPHERQQKPLPRGSAKMRLADALGVREHKDPD